jgi:hypothetical protein
MASKKIGKGKAAKKTPPPKVEKKGKVTKVKFTGTEQRDEVLREAEANERTTFHLSPEEIAQRKKDHEKEYRRLLARRDKLRSLEMARDATKAELDATDLGQKLKGLKEECKAEEIVIAALQNKVETLAVEALTGRTAEYQKPLSFDDGDDGDGPAPPKQPDLPLGPPPAPAGAAPAPEPSAPAVQAVPEAVPEPPPSPEEQRRILAWLAENGEQGTHKIALALALAENEVVRNLAPLAKEGLVKVTPWCIDEPGRPTDLRQAWWELPRALPPELADAPALPPGPIGVIEGTFEDAPALSAGPPRGLLPAATTATATTPEATSSDPSEPPAEAAPTATATAKPSPETLENAGRVLALLRQRGKPVVGWDVMRQIDLSVDEARASLGLLIDRGAIQGDGPTDGRLTMWSLVQTAEAPAAKAGPDDEPEPPPPTGSKKKIAHRDTKPAKGHAPSRKAGGQGARAQRATDELLARTTSETWRSALDQEVRLFVARHGNPVAETTLVVHGPAPAAIESACRKLLADANAITRASGGSWEPSAAVADDMHRLVDDWVHDLIEHAPGNPRVSDLATLTELPKTLLLAVCERLHKAGRIEWGDSLSDPKLFPLAPAKKAAE